MSNNAQLDNKKADKPKIGSRAWIVEDASKMAKEGPQLLQPGEDALLWYPGDDEEKVERKKFHQGILEMKVDCVLSKRNCKLEVQRAYHRYSASPKMPYAQKLYHHGTIVMYRAIVSHDYKDKSISQEQEAAIKAMDLSDIFNEKYSIGSQTRRGDGLRRIQCRLTELKDEENRTGAMNLTKRFQLLKDFTNARQFMKTYPGLCAKMMIGLNDVLKKWITNSEGEEPLDEVMEEARDEEDEEPLVSTGSSSSTILERGRENRPAGTPIPAIEVAVNSPTELQADPRSDIDTPGIREGPTDYATNEDTIALTPNVTFQHLADPHKMIKDDWLSRYREYIGTAMFEAHLEALEDMVEPEPPFPLQLYNLYEDRTPANNCAILSALQILYASTLVRKLVNKQSYGHSVLGCIYPLFASKSMKTLDDFEDQAAFETYKTDREIIRCIPCFVMHSITIQNLCFTLESSLPTSSSS